MIKYSIWKFCLLTKVHSRSLASKQFFQGEYSTITLIQKIYYTGFSGNNIAKFIDNMYQILANTLT